MMKTQTAPKKDTKVIPLRAIFKKPRRSPADKWTPAAIKLGFCVVPSILLWGQKRLDLSSEELNIVMHLADFWWDANDLPYPSKDTLAGRMGISARQVQRHLSSMEKKGLLKRIQRFRGKSAQTSNRYSLDGLIKKITALEPEFRKAVEQNKLRRKKVETKSA